MPHPHPPFPPFPPGPHHPQYPFDPRMWYTDVEPAYEKYAECECHMPPMPDKCVCVTEEDAQNWNGAYSAYSAISAGLDIQAIQSAAQLLTSADYWNQTYEVVSAGSATWNTLPDVVSAFKSSAEYLQWQINSAMDIKVDNITISGDGHNVPLGVTYSERYDALIEYLENLTASTPDLQKLWDAMEDCKDDVMKYIAALSGGHVQNYELILQMMGKTPTSVDVPIIWQRDDGMQSDKPHTYDGNKTLNWMYYSTYSAQG